MQGRKPDDEEESESEEIETKKTQWNNMEYSMCPDEINHKFG